jgi:hypothetical protein
VLPDDGVLLLRQLRHPERVEDVFAVMSSSVVRFTGTVRWPKVWPFGYVNCQANCCATTRIRGGLSPAWLFCARTIALTIEIAVTSTVGIAVQTISRPVWPWTGGPSESSSGGRGTSGRSR